MEENKPVHIAIIPDGNRRWGELHKISREEAYAIGIDKIQDVLTWCREFDIKMISFWGFSMDNFKRDSSEVGKLFELFKRNLKRVLDSEQRKKYDVRVKFFGSTCANSITTSSLSVQRPHGSLPEIPL